MPIARIGWSNAIARLLTFRPYCFANSSTIFLAVIEPKVRPSGPTF